MLVLCAPAGALAAVGDPVVAAAGDIACARVKPGPAACHQAATSDLITARSATLARVFTLGDNAYPCASLAQLMAGYDPTWGRFKAKTSPGIGNHEYAASGAGCDSAAAGYFQYFGAASQPNGANGYYFIDVTGKAPSAARWRIVMLNSNCNIVACSAASPQERFLANALATAPKGACIAAAWHHPRFGANLTQPLKAVAPFWADLSAAHAALILNGHSHYYQRFRPQNTAGASDPNGPTEFIVGTGGKSLDVPGATTPNTAVLDASHFGVIFLTLGASSYSWQFVAEGGAVLDTGSAPCTPVR